MCVAFIALVAVIVKHIPGAANRKTPRMTLLRIALMMPGECSTLPSSVASTLSEVAKALTQENSGSHLITS